MQHTRRLLLQQTLKKRPMVVNAELPEDPRIKQRWVHICTFLGFAGGVSALSFGIFNFEKMSSPVMNATMYSLRRSTEARDLLGSTITFSGLIPWVWGEVNTMRGNVDCTTKLSGDKGSAQMILKAKRGADGSFNMIQWDLISKDKTINLLKDPSIDLYF